MEVIKMSKLYLTIGIPGAGKTTYVREHFKDVIVVSTDSIREELFGSESNLYHPSGDDTQKTEKEKVVAGHQMVFSEAYARCEKALSEGKDVVFDATNLSRWNRSNVRRRLAPFFDEYIAIYFEPNLEVSLKRNRERSRHVPEERIRAMAKKIEAPSDIEAFKEVWTIT